MMGNKTFLFLMAINVHVVMVLAWLPPERCKQGSFVRSKRDLTAYPNLIISAPPAVNIAHAPVVNDITRIALNQNKNLNETYTNSKFFGVPIRAWTDYQPLYGYYMYVPNSCTFHTYNPNLLSSVYCQEGVACKLSHTVSTTKSYTASEGYNWGVKLSAKASVLGLFEAGGEASTGGSYTCTYTEGRTTTDTVECSVAGDAAAGKTLQLYNVQSDMECQFSTVEMVADERNNKSSHCAVCQSLTNDERKEIFKASMVIFHYAPISGVMLADADRMSDVICEKMSICYPEYNPYTDLLDFYDESLYDVVIFYKEKRVSAGPKRIIPFTNENGNSVYQYACVLT